MRTSSRVVVTFVASVALASLACSGGRTDGGTAPRALSAEAPAAPDDAQAAGTPRRSSPAGALAPLRSEVKAELTGPAPVPEPAPHWSLGTDAFALALDPDGNLDLLARSHLSEVDAQGRVLWDTGWEAIAGEVRTAGRLAVMDSGAVVVGGDLVRDDGSRGAFARAFDTAGSLAWDRTWPGEAFVDLDARDHVVALLASDQTHAVDCDGATLWDAPVSGTVVRVGHGGNVHLGTTDALRQRGITTLRAEGGAPLWTLRLDDSTLIKDSLLTDMIVDSDGNLYVTGYRRYRRDPRDEQAQFQSIAAKIAADGAVRWRHDTDIEETYAAVVDAAGRVTVAGTNRSVNTGDRALHVVQYEPDGQERWNSWGWFPLLGRPGLALGREGTVLVAATYDSPTYTEAMAYDAGGTRHLLATAYFDSDVFALRAAAQGMYLLVRGAVVSYAAP